MPSFAARILLEAITDDDEKFIELFHKVIPNKRVYDLAGTTSDWINSAERQPIYDYWWDFLEDGVRNTWLREQLCDELDDDDIDYIMEEMLEYSEKSIDDDDIVYKRGCSLCKLPHNTPSIIKALSILEKGSKCKECDSDSEEESESGSESESEEE